MNTQVTGSEVYVKTDCPVRRKKERKQMTVLCSVNLSSVLDGVPKMSGVSTGLTRDNPPAHHEQSTSGDPCRNLDLLSAWLETTFLEGLFVL